MNTQVIRNQSEVDSATHADLVHTWNELRGESIVAFPSLAIARTQVRMAILAAENEAGKAGVPKGTAPVAKTVAELGRNPYAEGTMSHALHEEIARQAPIAPRPKKAELPPEQQAPRVTLDRVRATNAGTSRVQEGSVRGAVLRAVRAAPGGVITVLALEELLKQPVRGHLQKLIEKGHVEPVQEQTLDHA